jgi:hypothetical protein
MYETFALPGRLQHGRRPLQRCRHLVEGTTLRNSEEKEVQGLNLTQHGEEGYALES